MKKFWGEIWIIILVVAITACQNEPPEPPQPTFYHWQTRLAPDSLSRALLAEADADRLYVKAYDLIWENGRATPTAILELGDTTGLPPLVPVIFITQEVIQQQPVNKLPALAKNMAALLQEILGNDFPEVQLDCDWTARTQVPYFSLLQSLRELFPDKTISCTIRLHQYRDRKTQGIPPVDRGVLMAYNVGELAEWSTENSIIDTTLLKGYLRDQPPYPIPLDPAIAVYDWAVVFRNDALAYLINEPDLRELRDTSRFAALTSDSLRYVVKTSTYYEGIYLYRGDLIRREIAPVELIDSQLKIIERHTEGYAPERIFYYRLGSRQWGE
ncbi:hypothetical protein [Lewinella sp. W8]|uniref:hypothetical protein n=1 Tax=Lewinella sp. W8 TaxID=2528208 RepID=UPI001067C08D|nr:hypothetical protein [Lewinella sp. W8]MTB52360.1 hypothetical protein [Lewinella sp. W8]